MTYSRKRYWLAMAGVFTIAAATDTLMIWLHPAHASLWIMPIVAVVFALGLLAYFSQDEIQHQNSMRAWYWGGSLAIMFALIPIILISSNTMLVMTVDFLPHPGKAAEAVSHAPKVYFVLGAMAALLTQCIGFFLARIVQRFRS
jgi:hypothetical protein